MTRLFVPFGSDDWPQQTHLVLDEAETTLKVARGDSFTLSVKVRPRRQGPGIGRGRPIISPTARTPPSRCARSKEANSAGGSSRSISRSGSR